MSDSIVTNENLYSKEILVLNGSPNMLGSTFRLIQQFQQALIDNGIDDYLFRQFDLYSMDIKPCCDCKNCQHGLCHMNHLDGYEEILEAMQAAEIIVLASPVYFSGFPAPLKAFIDRSQQFFSNNFKDRDLYFPNKGMGVLFLCSGRNDHKAEESITACAETFFYSINRNLEGTILIGNTDKKPNFRADFGKIIEYIKKNISLTPR